MKRKIAILLSALMVTTALPMNVSAATIKSASTESGVKPGTSTVGKYLDTDSKNANTVRKSTLTKDTLTKNRFQRANADFKIEKDSTNTEIEEGTAFIIELKNGKFPDGTHNGVDNFQDLFGYVAFDAEGNKLEVVNNKLTKTTTNGTVTVYDTYEKALAAISGSTPTVGEFTFDVGDAANPNANDALVVEFTTDFSESFGSTTPEAKAVNVSFNTKITVDGKVEVSGVEITSLTGTKGSYTLGTRGDLTDKLTYGDTGDTKVSIAMAEALKKKYEAEMGTRAPENNNTPYVPYTITRESDTTAKVTLPYKITKDGEVKYNVPELVNNYGKEVIMKVTNKASKNEFAFAEVANVAGAPQRKIIDKIYNTNGTKEVTPKISIPFGGVEVTEAGDVSISTKSYYGNTVSATSNFVVGKAAADTETEATIGEVKRFEDKLELDNVTIKEVIRNSITATDKGNIKLRLSNGFIFKTIENIKLNGKGSGFDNLEGKTPKFGGNETDEGIVEIEIRSGLTDRDENGAFFNIENLLIVPENDDVKNGEVKLTISGAGITTQTITIGEKAVVGFNLETLEDPKEIVSGRYYTRAEENMEGEDNITVDFKFSEKIPNSLLSQRNLDFIVPEGVKIVGFEDIKAKNFTSAENGLDTKETKAFYTDPEKNAKSYNEDFEIVNGGTTLRLKRGAYGTNGDSKLAEIEGKLKLSVDANYEGDITLSVEGGGQSIDDTKPVVIAKAVKPVKIKTKVSDVNMGYQKTSVADIVIEETRPGMLLEDNLFLTIDSVYGDSEIDLSDGKVSVGKDDELILEDGFGWDKEAKKFKIEVKRSSYEKPSIITISDVKIGSTRSVPFGSYDLKVSGGAVVNNHEFDYEKAQVNRKAEEVLDFKADGYTQKYINVVTPTNTESLDKEVQLKVGEKVVVVDGKEMEMDVASYIQSESDSLMVPLRFVSGALLGIDSKEMDTTSKISFDNNTKVVTIYYGSGAGQKMIQFQAGSNVMSINGTEVNMEYGVKAEIKNGRTFVPYRALGQALGAEVYWDAATRTAGYNTDVTKKEEVKKEEVKEEAKKEETKTEEAKKEETKTDDSKKEEAKTDK